VSKIQRAALARDIEDELEIMLWVLSGKGKGTKGRLEVPKGRKCGRKGRHFGKSDYLFLLNRLPC